jgi:Mn2+/Fe2+ NRAMP family transporter
METKNTGQLRNNKCRFTLQSVIAAMTLIACFFALRSYALAPSGPGNVISRSLAVSLLMAGIMSAYVCATARSLFRRRRVLIRRSSIARCFTAAIVSVAFATEIAWHLANVGYWNWREDLPFTCLAVILTAFAGGILGILLGSVWGSASHRNALH